MAIQRLYIYLLFAVTIFSTGVDLASAQTFCSAQAPSLIPPPLNASPPSTPELVEVPVAFHIITASNGITGFVSRATVEQQIDVLNAAFTNPDTDIFASPSYAFELVALTYTANDSYFGVLNGDSGDVSMKQDLHIDVARVLNIYVTDISDSGIAGYASFPTSFADEDNPRDGVVIDYTSMPGGSNSNANQGDVAVHEVGHYFGLYHTFHNGGGNACGNTLSTGDFVIDTNPHKLENYGCSGSSGCGTTVPPLENYMNYTSDQCKTEFTIGQFDRMGSEVASRRPTLASGGGGQVRLLDDLVVAASQTYTFLNVELQVTAGKQVDVYGALNAEGTVFTERVIGQGWDGLKYRNGSDGTVTASIIKETSGTGVYAYNADVDFEDTQILNAGSYGLYATAGSVVHFTESGSPAQFAEISDSGSRGVYAGNSADIYISNADILRSGQDGVSSYKGEVFLLESQVLDSGDYGAEGLFLSQIGFGDPGTTRSGPNNLFEDNSTGTLKAHTYAYLDAEDTGSDEFDINSFRRKNSELHARADGGDILAECNWWDSSSGPNSTYVQTLNGGVFDGSPYLDQAPTPTTSGCGVLSLTGGGSSYAALTVDAPRFAQQRRGRSATSSDEMRSGPPEGMDPQRWRALREGRHSGETLGLLIAAVNQAETPRDAHLAYGAIAREVRDGTVPGLDAFLVAQSRQEADRPYALTALVEVRHAEGQNAEARALAETLAEEYAETNHAGQALGTLVTLAVEAGDEAAASEALSRLQTLWPEDEVTVLLTDEVAQRFERSAKRPASQPPAAYTEATPVEVVVLGAPYPNPAISAVTVPLVLAETAVVRVAVYDLLGRVVATLAEGRTPAGGHLLALDTSALAAGTYVVRAVTPHATQTQRLTITR